MANGCRLVGDHRPISSSLAHSGVCHRAAAMARWSNIAVERTHASGRPSLLGLKTMSLLDKLRKDATRESDPEIRRQRLAKIDDVESDVRDFDERLAGIKATLAEPGTVGR